MGLIDNVNVNVGGNGRIIDTLSTYVTKVLKPNIVDGKNVLTQEMLSSKNTKYVIKYNYELLGATLTIPQNVILEFDGGSIKNGTLVGNETILVYNQEEEDVFKNVLLEGSFERSTSAIADKMDNTNGMAKIYLKKNKPLATQLTQPNTIYVIQYDFTLGEDITVPANCVLEFDGGSIDGNSYNLIGNILNQEIFISWFKGNHRALSKLNLSGHTVIFDVDTVFNDTFLIKNVSHLKLDGRKHTITRANGGFFRCEGTVEDIEICNFVCNGNLNGDFVYMSASTISSNIRVHDNYINTIRIGISFNAHNRNSSENGSCDNCVAENNIIIGNHNTDVVGYYGIHLANANNCVIRNNVIKNIGRHSIYHAYGHNNSILNNTVEYNGVDITTGNHFPALNIIRDSKNVIVKDNIFRNNNGADILVMGSPYDDDVTLDLDKSVNGVYIIGNQFYHTIGMTWPGKYNIAVGRQYIEDIETSNVIIQNNSFVKSQETGKTLISISTVNNLTVSENNFILSAGCNSAVCFSLNAELDPSHSFINIINNNYISSNVLENYIYSFPTDNLITKDAYYRVFNINNNKYNNRRGASSINYELYPSYTKNSLDAYPNLETGAIIHTVTTRDIQDGFTPNTGHYDIIGDIYLCYTQNGNRDTNRGIMGYVCAAPGNPGTWRPFGFNAMNFEIGTTGEGFPGAWNGRIYNAQRFLGVAYGGVWYRGDGYAAMNKEGTRLVRNSGQTADRPSLNGGYDEDTLGYRFYDRTIGKVIHWCHNRWEEGDGAEAGVARSGDTSSRPSGDKIYVGFVYFDTSLSKPIYAKEITSSPWNVVWVDATGTTV